MKYTLTFICAAFVLFTSAQNYKTKPFISANNPEIPNYEDESSWAVLPWKYESGLQQYSPTKKEVENLKTDVFYVYPTLLIDKKDTRWNVSITDESLNNSILNSAVKYQASPFATSGKIYAPYYRQAHLRSYTLYNSGGKEALEVAYSDVKKAFETYLDKYNDGRPIIIVSHSQGTTHTKRLLKDFFDGKPLKNQLVAAYLVGIKVSPDEFNTIKPMTLPSETGGFVSWNTRKKGSYPETENWYKGSITTNPITWDTTKTTELNQHKGFLYSNDKTYTNALKIEVTDGLIWSTVPKFPMRFFMFFIKNYHFGDINLFWQDIKENAELRTKKWLEQTN
jgi:hypothetical protein